jgi:hypothetical protein
MGVADVGVPRGWRTVPLPWGAGHLGRRQGDGAWDDREASRVNPTLAIANRA